MLDSRQSHRHETYFKRQQVTSMKMVKVPPISIAAL